MNPYTASPNHFISIDNVTIASFMDDDFNENIDKNTVESFGAEWSKFSQFDEEEIQKIGLEYFDIVPMDDLSSASVVLDLGCGSGRWSKFMAPIAQFIESVDPSTAVVSAAKMLSPYPNVRVTQASVDRLPFADESFDMIVTLGVLHHIPDTLKALQTATRKLKPNGTLLLYLYYSFDNKPIYYRILGRFADFLVKLISGLPHRVKLFACDLMAIVAYMPFVLLARLAKLIGYKSYQNLPLGYYADKSFQIIRNDSLDRFGTALFRRFSRVEIESMLQKAGYSKFNFSENAPYWHVYARKG